MGLYICQVLEVYLFKRFVVTLNSECTAKDIGVELHCTKDTSEQLILYVGIALLHRH